MELIFQRLDDNSDDALEIMAQCLENYLIDITQNHIDFNHIFNAQKSARNSLQFNCFTMAPHYQMSVLQMLLVRGLIASFLEKPYIQPFIRWGTTIQPGGIKLSQPVVEIGSKKSRCTGYTSSG